jgi:hypothetical protein
MDEFTGPAFPRRSLLRSLVVAAGVGAELVQVTPAPAQTHAHEGRPTMPAAPAGKSPLYFSASQYDSLRMLCQLIMPPGDAAERRRDGVSGGALEAGVPVFIDLLASENKEYQRRLSGGLSWLDAVCAKRFDTSFVECTSAQQKEVLDVIAYRANAALDSSVLPGIEFFALLRDLVLDGFFTSQIGIEYLEFRGNHAISSFAGCPEVKG